MRHSDDNKSSTSLKRLLVVLAEDIMRYFRLEADRMRLEAELRARAAMAGALVIGLAAMFGIAALVLLFQALALALSTYLESAVHGYLASGGIALLVFVPLILFGINRLQKALEGYDEIASTEPETYAPPGTAVDPDPARPSQEPRI